MAQPLSSHAQVIENNTALALTEYALIATDFIVIETKLNRHAWLGWWDGNEVRGWGVCGSEGV
jgi:uncharacterized protein YjlB